MLLVPCVDMTESKAAREDKGEDLKLFRSLIKAHQDFPKKGILFQCVSFPSFRLR